MRVIVVEEDARRVGVDRSGIDKTAFEYGVFDVFDLNALAAGRGNLAIVADRTGKARTADIADGHSGHDGDDRSAASIDNISGKGPVRGNIFNFKAHGVSCGDRAAIGDAAAKIESAGILDFETIGVSRDCAGVKDAAAEFAGRRNIIDVKAGAGCGRDGAAVANDSGKTRSADLFDFDTDLHAPSRRRCW